MESSYEVRASVGLTAGQVLGPSIRRKRVILQAPQANRYSVSFFGTAVLDQDITVFPGGLPVKL